MWKRALSAAVLVLTVSPALAADTKVAPAVASAAVPARDVSDLNNATAVRDISERVNTLEREVNQLIPAAPTRDEVKRAALQKQQEEDFMNHVWSDP